MVRFNYFTAINKAPPTIRDNTLISTTMHSFVTATVATYFPIFKTRIKELTSCGPTVHCSDGTKWCVKLIVGAGIAPSTVCLVYLGDIFVTATVKLGFGDKLSDNTTIYETTRSFSQSQTDSADTTVPLHLLSLREVSVCVQITVYNHDITSSDSATVKPLPTTDHSVLCDIANMFGDAKTADVVLVSEEGMKTPAHKAILSARSPYFRAKFTSNMSDSTASEISFSDFSAAVVNEFVRYLYTDSCILTDDIAFDLATVADKYHCPGLLSQCERYIDGGLSVQNAVNTLVFADQLALEVLKRSALDFVVQNSLAVLSGDGCDLLTWELMKEVVQHMVARQKLNECDIDSINDVDLSTGYKSSCCDDYSIYGGLLDK